MKQGKLDALKVQVDILKTAYKKLENSMNGKPVWHLGFSNYGKYYLCVYPDSSGGVRIEDHEWMLDMDAVTMSDTAYSEDTVRAMIEKPEWTHLLKLTAEMELWPSSKGKPLSVRKLLTETGDEIWVQEKNFAPWFTCPPEELHYKNNGKAVSPIGVFVNERDDLPRAIVMPCRKQV